MKALALDLGASGGKFLSGNLHGGKIHVKEIHRFQNKPVEIGGHLFWDIRRIYADLLDGLRKAASEGFSSFGVDSFCNDYGLLDASGNLTSPVYMYRDSRTEGVLEWMDQIIPPRELYARTGNQRARFNTLVQLAAQSKAADNFYLENANHLLFVPDLLNYFLCGEMTSEYTIASVSQVYNRTEDRWDSKIIRSFAIPEGIFPTLIPTGSRLAEAKADIIDLTGGKSFSICAVGQHDTASAVAAVPSPESHCAYISSGTWCLMGTETDEMICTDSAFQENFANEGAVGGRNRFLKNIMGLWLVQECQRQFGMKGIMSTFEEMDMQAEQALPFQSIINPDDPLFFEPGDMIGKIQSRCKAWHQPVPERPGEIIRCIKESLALSYRATLETLETLTGFHFPCVHILGGGARSEFLNQFAASAMQRPVFAGPYEAAALGNLCAQFISAGEINGWDEARGLVSSSFHIQEFLPEKFPGWDEAFERFLLINKQGLDENQPKIKMVNGKRN